MEDVEEQTEGRVEGVCGERGGRVRGKEGGRGTEQI